MSFNKTQQLKLAIYNQQGDTKKGVGFIFSVRPVCEPIPVYIRHRSPPQSRGIFHSFKTIRGQWQAEQTLPTEGNVGSNILEF